MSVKEEGEGAPLTFLADSAPSPGGADAGEIGAVVLAGAAVAAWVGVTGLLSFGVVGHRAGPVEGGDSNGGSGGHGRRGGGGPAAGIGTACGAQGTACDERGVGVRQGGAGGSAGSGGGGGSSGSEVGEGEQAW